MIVKVQRCLSDPNGPVLIYNQSRSFHISMPLTIEWLELMAGSVKEFFKIKLYKGQIKVMAKVTGQSW